jgi:hypothetical protein
VWTGESKFSWGGLAAETVGGVVSGGIGGACIGLTDGFGLTACTAAAAAAGNAVQQGIDYYTNGTPIDPWEIGGAALTSVILGPIADRIGDGVSPATVGRLPYKLSNLWNPGPNAIREYEDALISGVTDSTLEGAWDSLWSPEGALSC